MALRRKSLLLYGTVSQRDDVRFRPWASRLVEELLAEGWSFVSRNGSVPTSTGNAAWARPDRVPVDDVVIDTVASWCSERGIDVSSRLVTVVTDDRQSGRDVGQRFLVAPAGRFDIYLQLLELASLVVLIGGADGVLRMGFLAHGLGHPVVPLSTCEGTAKELARSFYTPLAKGRYFQRVGHHDVARIRGTAVETTYVREVARRYRHPGLWFCIREFCARRMAGTEFATQVWRLWERLSTQLGRLLLTGALILLLGYFVITTLRGLFDAGADLWDRFVTRPSTGTLWTPSAVAGMGLAKAVRHQQRAVVGRQSPAEDEDDAQPSRLGTDRMTRGSRGREDCLVDCWSRCLVWGRRGWLLCFWEREG